MKERIMVIVEWHDARFFPGTYNTEAITKECKMQIFKSLGYLVSQDQITTIIAGEQNDEEEYRDITLIPSGSIISIRMLSLGSSM